MLLPFVLLLLLILLLLLLRIVLFRGQRHFAAATICLLHLEILHGAAVVATTDVGRRLAKWLRVPSTLLL